MCVSARARKRAKREKKGKKAREREREGRDNERTKKIFTSFLVKFFFTSRQTAPTR